MQDLHPCSAAGSRAGLQYLRLCVWLGPPDAHQVLQGAQHLMARGSLDVDYRYVQHCCSTYRHFSKCMYVWGCRALLLLTPTLDVASSQGVLLSACTHPWRLGLRMRRHDERPVAMDQQPQHSSAGKSRLCMLAKCRKLESQPCPCPPTFHPHRCSAAVRTNTQATPQAPARQLVTHPTFCAHRCCTALLYRRPTPEAAAEQ
jgi:hypothetical protein